MYVLTSSISIAMKIIHRQDAIKQNLDFYFTGITCKHGHLCERYTLSRTCVECGRKTSRDWRSNPENRDHYNLYQQAYSGHNLRFIKMYLNDPDEIWFDKTYRTRTALKRATPKWADHSEIRRMYEECVRLSEQMNVPFEVDHHIPIHGRKVCGLHVPENLKVVSNSLNKIKANKFNADLASVDLLRWLKERKL